MTLNNAIAIWISPPRKHLSPIMIGQCLCACHCTLHARLCPWRKNIKDASVCMYDDLGGGAVGGSGRGGDKYLQTPHSCLLFVSLLTSGQSSFNLSKQHNATQHRNSPSHKSKLQFFTTANKRVRYSIWRIFPTAFRHYIIQAPQEGRWVDAMCGRCWLVVDFPPTRLELFGTYLGGTSDTCGILNSQFFQLR